MKLTNTDWNYLCKNTFRPGASLLTSAIVLGVSVWYHGAQLQLVESYTANQEAISEDYDALVYRRRILDRYHRRYKELKDLGFVGRERRLDWIETIRSVARDLDIPNVTYSLEPQVEVVPPVRSTSPNTEIQIFLSHLELELGLVHELDLLHFFTRLESEAPGLMKVDRCDLERQFDVGQKLAAESNIVATCSLVMFSVITSDIQFAAVELVQ